MVLTGMEEGTFPEWRAMEEADELSEERRRADVGITRAKRRLYVTRAAVRAQWGQANEMMPSQFLDEIPDRPIDWKRRETGMEGIRSGWSRRGFDDEFWVPHSRNTTILREDIEKVPELKIMSCSEKAGVYAVKTRDGKQVFLMGHAAYDRDTLLRESLRDVAANVHVPVPAH